MSKYIIEIEDTPFTSPGSENELYKATNFRSLVFDEIGLSKLEKTGVAKVQRDEFFSPYEDSYNSGLLAAWETARKMAVHEYDGGFSETMIHEIFGLNSYSVFCDFKGVSGVNEVIRRIREYEDNHKKEKERVNELAEEIGINKLYSIVKELRGE